MGRRRLDKLKMSRDSLGDGSSLASKREVDPDSPVLERRKGSARLVAPRAKSSGVTKSPRGPGYVHFQGGTTYESAGNIPIKPTAVYIAFNPGAIESYLTGETKRDFILWRAGQISSLDSGEIVMGVRYTGSVAGGETY